MWWKRSIQRDWSALQKAFNDERQAIDFVEQAGFAGLKQSLDLKCLRESMQLAARFKAASTARAAWKIFPASIQKKAEGRLSSFEARTCLAVQSGSLLTLAMIAHATAKGCRLVVEECRFSRDYLRAFLTRTEGRLCGLAQLPGQVPSGCSGAPCLMVTFSDRPLSTYTGTMLLRSEVGAFYMSDADALLSRLPFDHTCPPLPVVGIKSGDDAEISSERDGDLKQATEHYFAGLAAEIMGAPHEYIAWRQLASRSVLFRRKITVNGRSILKSFLLCSKIREQCRDGDACVDAVQRIGRLPKGF